MLKTGLTSVTFRNLGIEQIVSLAGAAGADSIEWGGDIHVPPGDLSAARRAAAASARAGLAVSSYGSYWCAGKSEDFTPVLDAAEALGAPVIRVWAGEDAPAECSEETFQRIAEDLSRISSAADQRGMRVAMEYHRGTLTENAAGARAILSACRAQNLGTYWQPNPDIGAEENAHALTALLPYLAGVHVFKWTKGNERHPLALGEDEWRAYIRIVRRADVSCCFMIEFVAGDRPEQYIRDARVLNRLVTEEELKG